MKLFLIRHGQSEANLGMRYTGQFDVPLTVTYKYDDGEYKFVLIVADESGALALDYSEAVSYDELLGNLEQAKTTIDDMMSQYSNINLEDTNESLKQHVAILPHLCISRLKCIANRG